MKRGFIFFTFLAVATCVGAMTSAAQAQATRTWVSGLGDDANPCSRTAPCKTFAGAYSRTAAGGEIDAIDPGGFGTISIGHALTIDGGGGQVASILASSTNAVNVTAGNGDWVTLRNLRINGIVQTSFPGLIGIKVNSVGVLTLENDVIQGFSGIGVDFEPSSPAGLNVVNTVVQDATGGGLFAQTGTQVNQVSIQNSSFINNGTFGVRSGLNSRINMKDSTVSGTRTVSSSADGLHANGGVIATDRVTVTTGGTGIHSSASGFVWISNTVIENNSGVGLVADSGGQILTFLNNYNANNTGGPGAPTGNAIPGPM